LVAKAVLGYAPIFLVLMKKQRKPMSLWPKGAMKIASKRLLTRVPRKAFPGKNRLECRDVEKDSSGKETNHTATAMGKLSITSYR